MLQRSTLLVCIALALPACVASEPPTKAEARLTGGRDHDGADLCARHAWYGDGECDAFCPEPDPDCAECPDPTAPGVRYASTVPGSCEVWFGMCAEGEEYIPCECGAGCFDPTPEVDELTPEECSALGGILEYDPGDGRTHRADYVCANGEPTLGFVPVPIEGAACCPVLVTLLPAECAALGGELEYDPGDGRTRSPDYVCENGERSLGFVSVPIEGAACCPPASDDPLTPAECAALGGELEYDPGDGRTHSPDYVCLNGEPSLGFVSVPIEGAACCPPASPEVLTVEECEDGGGTVVGDPGDGSTHDPDYRCEDGRRPIGRVDFGIEGGVCCPSARAPLSEMECHELGGELEYDPGDGRTHSPDYVCLNGEPSLGFVAVPIEGAACCPPAT
jgi:hypothetical protein